MTNNCIFESLTYKNLINETYYQTIVDSCASLCAG